MCRSTTVPFEIFLAIAAIALSGCATATIEDAVPMSASQRAAAETVDEETMEASAFAAEEELVAPVSAPVTRGGFPNLNITPDTAAPQITNAERVASTRELKAAQQRANSRPAAATGGVQTPEQIRRLARQREEETLRRIEAR